MKKFFALKIMALILVGGAILTTTSCKEDPARDAFLGTYDVEETCTSGTDTYFVTITEDAAEDEGVSISNLYDWGDVVNGTCSGSSVTIATQTVDGLTYSGTGTISGSVLTISLTLTDGIDTEACTLVCTMQE